MHRTSRKTAAPSSPASAGAAAHGTPSRCVLRARTRRPQSREPGDCPEGTETGLPEPLQAAGNGTHVGATVPSAETNPENLSTHLPGATPKPQETQCLKDGHGFHSGNTHNTHDHSAHTGLEDRPPSETQTPACGAPGCGQSRGRHAVCARAGWRLSGSEAPAQLRKPKRSL